MDKECRTACSADGSPDAGAVIFCQGKMGSGQPSSTSAFGNLTCSSGTGAQVITTATTAVVANPMVVESPIPDAFPPAATSVGAAPGRLSPATPASERVEPLARPRSPLRGGTELDGLVPGRPLVNSLLDRSDLRLIEPPIEPSPDFTRCRGFQRQLERAAVTVQQCETFELVSVSRKAVAKLHQPMVKKIADRKLPSHIPSDPIDPMVIFVKAIPLVHCVLHQDQAGNDGHDLDGVAYIVERLGEAECLRTHDQDVRFDVLLALSSFLAAIIEKSEEECWACVEAA